MPWRASMAQHAWRCYPRDIRRTQRKAQATHPNQSRSGDHVGPCGRRAFSPQATTSSRTGSTGCNAHLLAIRAITWPPLHVGQLLPGPCWFLRLSRPRAFCLELACSGLFRVPPRLRLTTSSTARTAWCCCGGLHSCCSSWRVGGTATATSTPRSRGATPCGTQHRLVVRLVCGGAVLRGRGSTGGGARLHGTSRGSERVLGQAAANEVCSALPQQ
jgi:hypothetical protein